MTILNLTKEVYLNMDNCNGYDIFRADKSVASIYVSEKMKELIEGNGFTGFMFTVQK